MLIECAGLADSSGMRTRNVAWLMAIALALPGPTLAAGTLIPSGAGGSHWAWGLLRLPLMSFRIHPQAAESRAQGLHQRLEAASGWRTIGFTPHTAASGCFIKIDGKAEFERVEVVFSDDDLQAQELHGARHGKDLYELLTWDDARVVACVRVRACARSEQASFQLLLRD